VFNHSLVFGRTAFAGALPVSGWPDFRVLAVLDRPEVVAASNDPFGQQKSGRELTVEARRAHDDGERPAVQSDFKRLLGRSTIGLASTSSGPNFDDGDVLEGRVHAAILK
jgi:hypothetical protein